MPFVQFLIHSKKLLMFIKTIIFFIFNVSLFSIFLVGSILKSNGCTEVPDSDQQPCVSLLNTLIKDPQQRKYIVTALFKIKRKGRKILYCPRYKNFLHFSTSSSNSSRALVALSTLLYRVFLREFFWSISSFI